MLLAQALFLFLYRRRIVFTAEKAKLYSRKRKKKEDGVMSTKSMRILNVAAGVLLIAAGIYCLCNQDVALLSAGLLLGIFLLLSGVAEIVVFAAASGVMLGSGWLLLDGIQEWLGHSSYNTTANIYAHLDTSSKNTSASKMSNVVIIEPSISTSV